MFYCFCGIFLFLILLWFLKPRKSIIWKEKGIPYIKPSVTFGNFFWSLIGHESFMDRIIKIYRAMPNEKYYGTFFMRQTQLLIRDPNLLQTLLVKHHDCFTDHVAANSKASDDIFLKNTLMSMKGQKWRALRAKLTPLFTGLKMRGMFEIMKECNGQMVEFYKQEFDCRLKKNHPLDVELKNLFTRYSTDVIAMTVFGLQCNSFKEPDNIFFKMGQQVMQPQLLKFLFMRFFPSLFKLLDLRVFPAHIYDYFINIVRETIEMRQRERIIRSDLIDLLRQMQKTPDFNDSKPLKYQSTNQDDDLTITFEQSVAQAFVFFLAGFETVSVPMTFATYELACNPDIVEHLQQEIDEVLVKNNGNLTYEALANMRYLDNIVSETLRKWPPNLFTDRVCTKSFSFEMEGKILDFEPGMIINVPILGLHRDEKYFPNPENFDPDRFNEINKSNITPFSFIPFGIGPRSCIASRFAQMEIKLALFYLFGNFDFDITEKSEIPVQLEKTRQTAKNGFWFGLKLRKNHRHT